jgi:replicative DNA helicase
MTDQLPPSNYDAERAILGTMIKTAMAIGDIAVDLKIDDFYWACHQNLFRALIDLWHSGKVASHVDLTLLADLLQQRNQMEDLGGYDKLAEIYDKGGVLYRHHAEIVTNCALRRRLIQAASTILAHNYEGGQASELLAEAERLIFSAASNAPLQACSMRDAVRAGLAAIDQRLSGERSAGYRTGFEALDKIIVGLQPSELTTVAARPSVGKTTFAGALVVALAQQGHPTLFVSLEQSRAEIGERLLAACARINSHRLRTGQLNPMEIGLLRDAAQVLQKYVAWISDQPRQTVAMIATEARRLAMRGQLHAVIIDYIALIEPDSRKVSREEQIGSIAARLKELAKELDVPVVVLAQLNRDSEKRVNSRPKLSDLRDSGQIEHHSDMVVFLHRPESDDKGPQPDVEIIVAKNRNGMTGELMLRHIKAEMRFEEGSISNAFGGSS